MSIYRLSRLAASGRRAVTTAIALALLFVVALTASQPLAQAQQSLIAYTMVDQWPQRTAAASGLLQSPADLDVSFDKNVYIADPGIGGIQMLLPTGTFTVPFGVTGGAPQQLGRVGAIAVGPNPPPPGVQLPPSGMPPVPIFGERVYVLDTAIQRVVIYGTDGQYQSEWEKINGQGIAASSDLRVFVLDKDTSQVRVFDPATGVEKAAFGGRGTNNGEFTNFNDIDISPDGRVAAISDKRGLRVQLFDLATDLQMADPMSPAPLAKFRKAYDLTDQQYESQGNRCSGERVNALGGDKIFAGQGVQACLIEGRAVSFAIALAANKNTICRDTVSLPRLRGGPSPLYYALAVNNPNVGKCGEKRTELDTAPVVVKYSDEQLKQVETVWEAASNATSDNPLLFAPEAISMPQDGIVFVSDSSSQFRFFGADGKQVATAERSSQAGNFGGDFEFFTLIKADGSDVLGEVVGYYIKGRRTGQNFSIEGGIGRFKTVTKPTRTGLEKVIEPIWTDALISSFQQIEIPALAWNAATRELLVVRNDTVAQQRTQDVKIIRYAADGRKITPAFDLPDDGQSNPYVDMQVSADGRIFALDDLNDIVRVYRGDGTHVVDVPVAFDARAVAGGPDSPDGSVFVLREPGSIERYNDQGVITARLDGRPLASSDATTLTDIVVDKVGKVYVSDGQSSLISVFDATADRLTLPVPNDAECLFAPDATASPAQIQLGETTTVTLTLKGACGINEFPADIVVVVPYLSKLQQGVDPSATYITELTQLISRVNFGKHRVGLVTYYNTVTKDLPLTSDRNAYLQAVRGILRFDPPNQNVKPRLRDAIQQGATLFDAQSATRRKVMVLLRAEYCTTATELVPGECVGVPAAEDVAQQVRASGVTIIVTNSAFGAFDLASSDEDAVYGVENVHRRMVRYAPPAQLGTDLTLTNNIPTTMGVDANGISGGGQWQDPRIVWQLVTLDFKGATFSARLTPKAGGTWPTSAQAVADFTDGWGKPQQVTFPIPDVVVVAPTPTPTTPATATPLPTATATVLPTVAPTNTPKPPAKLYLPLLYLSRCKSDFLPVEVALAIDISSSMNAPTGAGGPTKMAAAREAAIGFIDSLRPADRVSLVAFDKGANTLSGLTSEREQVKNLVNGLTTGSGTRIDLGIQAGAATLAQHRPDATTVLILLTDGRPSSAPTGVLAAARTAREAGIDLYAIGLGSDVDPVLLAQAAGDPSHIFLAPRADGLGAIYAVIGARVAEVCQ